jgi:hypothetical protein
MSVQSEQTRKKQLVGNSGISTHFTHTYSLQNLIEIMSKEKKCFGMPTEETPKLVVLQFVDSI